jgi:hypothetical protein
MYSGAASKATGSVPARPTIKRARVHSAWPNKPLSEKWIPGQSLVTDMTGEPYVSTVSSRYLSILLSGICWLASRQFVL